MDEVAKLCFWLEKNGNTAPWEEVQAKFKVAFPNNPVKKMSELREPQLNGVMINSRGLPQFGKRLNK